MAHSHWPTREPFTDLNRRRRCDLPKQECDALWTAFQHGHVGQVCEKTVLPGNKASTCRLSMTPEELDARLSKRVKTGDDQQMG